MCKQAKSPVSTLAFTLPGTCYSLHLSSLHHLSLYPHCLESIQFILQDKAQLFEMPFYSDIIKTFVRKKINFSKRLKEAIFADTILIITDFFSILKKSLQ